MCIACVKTVDGEVPAYREALKFNKLRVINTADSSDSPRLHQFLIGPEWRRLEGSISPPDYRSHLLRHLHWIRDWRVVRKASQFCLKAPFRRQIAHSECDTNLFEEGSGRFATRKDPDVIVGNIL